MSCRSFSVLAAGWIRNYKTYFLHSPHYHGYYNRAENVYKDNCKYNFPVWSHILNSNQNLSEEYEDFLILRTLLSSFSFMALTTPRKRWFFSLEVIFHWEREVLLVFLEQCRLMRGVGPSHLQSRFEWDRFFSPVDCRLYRITQQDWKCHFKWALWSGHRKKLLQTKINGISYARPNLCPAIVRAAFLRTPVGFCSGMSVLAPTELGCNWQFCTNTLV